MNSLLIKSVEEYLNLFGSKDNFTAHNAIEAILYHYKDIRMVDFYLNEFPKESLILNYDTLDIGLYTKGYNCIRLSLQRAFKFFDDSDETIQIRLELHFEDLTDNSFYANSVSLSRFSDEDDEYEDILNRITDDVYYKQIVDRVPTRYELFINYDV